MVRLKSNRRASAPRGGKETRLLRIGVFGGSFDPPHVGHLIIAEQARVQLKLDRVIFIPAHMPPHKLVGTAASSEDRLRMTRLAVRGNPSFLVSDIELRRKGISYTIDTLRRLKKQIPGGKFFLIIGSDNYQEFRTWESPNDILQLCTLAVYPRPGFNIGSSRRRTKQRVRVLQGARVEVSSSLIRSRIARGLSIHYLVPESVEQMIVRRRLYVT